MAIPSFEELLGQARRISEDQASYQQSQLVGKSLGDFAQKLLFTGSENKKTYSSYLDPATGGVTELAQPYQTGGSLVDRLFGGSAPTNAPKGSVFLSPDKTIDYAEKSALEKQKLTGAENVAKIRAQAQIDAAKARGSRGPYAALLPDPVKEQVYNELERTYGSTIEPDQRTPLTLSHLKEFKDAGYIGDQFLKRIVPLFKDSLLGMPADAVDKALEMQAQVNQGRFPNADGTDTTPKRVDHPFRPKKGETLSFSTHEEAMAAKANGTVKSGDKIKIGGTLVNVK